MKSGKNIVVKAIWQAQEVYPKLQQTVAGERKRGTTNSFSIRLLNSIATQIEKIRIKFPQGTPVPKERIPRLLRQRYNISNLFHVRLIQNWRMMYSLMRGQNDQEVLCLVSIIAAHTRYSELMGYKGG